MRFFRFIQVQVVLFLIAVGGVMLCASFAWAVNKGYLPREAYEAPHYVPPPPLKPHIHFEDNGDGTLTDDNGLMWAQKDSYADLGKCLTWKESKAYVEGLNGKKFAGYDDWRMPSLIELASIYDNAWDTVMGHDQDPENPIHLDPQFAKGAAYWYWTSDVEFTKLTDCCARTLYFVSGITFVRRFSTCNNSGVRAVRGMARQ